MTVLVVILPFTHVLVAVSPDHCPMAVPVVVFPVAVVLATVQDVEVHFATAVLLVVLPFAHVLHRIR